MRKKGKMLKQYYETKLVELNFQPNSELTNKVVETIIELNKAKNNKDDLIFAIIKYCKQGV